MSAHLIRKSLIAMAAVAGFALVFPSIASAAGDVAKGKVTYDTNCMSCHGATGKGDGPVGAVLNPHPRDFSTGEFKFDTDGKDGPGTDADIAGVIRKGAAAYGGSPMMAPWPALNDGDVDNLVAFIRSLKK